MPSSRVFVDGSSQYLVVNSTPITEYPFTISAWFKADTPQADDVLVWIGDKDSSAQFWALAIGWNDYGTNPANSNVHAVTRVGARAEATTSSSYTANTWHHACGLFINSTSRKVYLDGGGEGTDATPMIPSASDRVAIGVAGDSSPTNYMDGKIALVILRNIELSGAEVAEEAAATSVAEALAIQTASIVAYWLNGTEVDTDHDTGTYDMTPVNSPTWDSGDWPFAAPGAGLSLPVAMAYYNRIRRTSGD